MRSHLHSIALTALCLVAAPGVSQSPPTPTPEPAGTKLVEIYHVVPGKQEAFLRAIARLDEANRRAGASTATARAGTSC